MPFNVPNGDLTALPAKPAPETIQVPTAAAYAALKAICMILISQKAADIEAEGHDARGWLNMMAEEATKATSHYGDEAEGCIRNILGPAYQVLDLVKSHLGKSEAHSN
jgi:hypothetical protein